MLTRIVSGSPVWRIWIRASRARVRVGGALPALML